MARSNTKWLYVILAVIFVVGIVYIVWYRSVPKAHTKEGIEFLDHPEISHPPVVEYIDHDEFHEPEYV